MTKLTARIAKELIEHEAIVREAYKDSKGIWTWSVGVTSASGHTVFPAYKDNPQTIRKCLEVYIWLLRKKYIPAVEAAFAGHALTQATIAWGALRIVPCFALGCAAYLLWQARPVAGRRPALGLCAALTAAGIVMAALGAHDAVFVPAFGALIYALACLTSSGSAIGTSRLGVWLGEVSYGIYMVCVPWKLLFVNAALKFGGFEGEVLPLWLWLVFLASVIPVAAAAHHIVERPARHAMKTWAARSRAHTPKFA